MIEVNDARRIIGEATKRIREAEKVPLASLDGRVLSDAIRAPFAMPRFTNAAMDGFAVIFQDIEHATEEEPVTLTVNQDLPAGATETCPVTSGSCARIMTGAPLPEGADTVVPFEQTSGFGSPRADIFRPPKQGANIRHVGEEVTPGTLLLEPGTILSASEIGILAAFGMESVSVIRRPAISILTAGDELRLPGFDAGPLAIYNSNLSMLEACSRAANIDVVTAQQVTDNPEAIRRALLEEMDECDILVTAGGISTGEYDFIQQLLLELGVQERFWKVSQKPGKPFFFGTAPSGALVFSLPGNPVSALVCWIVYCLPAIALMTGSAPPATIQATLDEPFPADRKRHRFLFGQLSLRAGSLHCRLSPKSESHMLTTVLGSNCIVEAPPSASSLSAGSVVACTPLPWKQLF